MLVTPYTRGRSWEYKALNMLRKDGYVCSRSAMSHGPVDIFAAKNGRVLLIQVKSGKTRLGRQASEDIIHWAKVFNADAQAWFFKKRGILEKRWLFRPKGAARPRRGGRRRPSLRKKPLEARAGKHA